MKNISLDIETYSSVDLSKSGVYKYAESKDFEILLFAYSVDYGEIKVIDLASGEKIPQDIKSALKNPLVKKWAFNANFERVCLSKYLREDLSPVGWRCSMVLSASLGLPLSLESVGSVLNLPYQKLKEGKSLIKYFCCPNKDNKRNLPTDDMIKWQSFKEYNKRDVLVEMEIQKRLKKYNLPDSEWENYYLDQIINDRGIMIDKDFVRAALICDEKYKKNVKSKLKNLTQIENPNSIVEMKNYLEKQNLSLLSLDKNHIKEVLNLPDLNEDVKEVLKLKQELSKSSVKKYSAMENVLGEDNRVRGLIQFYGTKTGRYAGRLIQVQNLPKNYLSDLEVARDLVKSGHGEDLDFLYDSVEDVLSQLIRTAFIPKEGYEFIVADFSAIEARVLSWLSKEKWRMEVFEKGGDIYCESASKMFKVKVEKNGENSHLRDKGKIAELALGYGGSVGALKSMGATSFLKEEELQSLVNAWRNANPHITYLWYEVDKIIKKVISGKVPMKLYNLEFIYENNMLFIVLPSKRKLCYRNPKIATNRFNKSSIVYEGVNSNKKWAEIESYGAKFVENIVQAIARDLLCEAIKNLHNKNFKIVLHVHDEVVIEVEKDKSSVEEICNLMTTSPPWAKDLSLKAEGYKCEFYRK